MDGYFYIIVYLPFRPSAIYQLPSFPFLHQVPIMVDLQNGGSFSWTYVSPHGTVAHLCVGASTSAFLGAYFPVAAGCHEHPDVRSPAEAISAKPATYP